MAAYSDFHNQHFEAKVTKALESVRRVLDVDRGTKIRLADGVDHEYKDKYKLADLMTNMTIVTLLSVLEELGLTKEVLRSMDKSKEITLRFSTCESCTFVKEEVVDEPLPFTKETQETTWSGTSESTTKKSTIEKIVKRVKKEYYTIEKDWELSIYAGIDVEKRTVLQERKGAIYEYIRDRRYDSGTIRDDIGPPFPPKKTYPHNELSLTWLLQQIDIEELKSHFAIDTSLENANTKTPRQNEQMEQAFWFCRSVNRWTRGVQGAFLQTVKRFSMDRTTKTAFDTFVREVSNAIFVPILPIMVDQSPKGGDAQRKLEQAAVGDEDQNEEFERISMGTEPESKSMVSLPPVNDSNDCEAVILSKLDTTTFLNEHARTLSEAVRTIQEQYDDREFECNLISSLETKMTVLSFHAQALVLELMGTISAIESMLKKQLVAAIGKQVRKVDLDQFMRYHNEKLFTICIDCMKAQ